jgi:dihydrofolate reductase
MRKLILYSAVSLDGYIAGPNHEIDWLFSGGDYGYKAFYESIDTTLSGYNTYSLALSFGNFPYPDKTNYVFSRQHQHRENTPVNFIQEDPAGFTIHLKEQPGKDIWLVGGGQINTVMMNAGLIDTLIISVHPIILGKGIPLFAGSPERSSLKLTHTITFPDGLLQATYDLR